MVIIAARATPNMEESRFLSTISVGVTGWAREAALQSRKAMMKKPRN
jgi:hypothetical protein